MNRELNVMDKIQEQKAKELDEKELQPLNPEGKEIAKHKRFSFDIVDTPDDPLR